mmetsp:Transcript_3810/g.8579  ORF Transcript_3810/g.8579 Transcript_3810/m.8579 type:complete len:200 (-) Transcript_3810:161-760(-)
MREGIASCGPEERPGEPVLINLGDYARDVAEHSFDASAVATALLIIQEGPRSGEFEVVVDRSVVRRIARMLNVGHRGDGGLDDVALLKCLVPLREQRRVVLLQAHELLVGLLESSLNLIQLVVLSVAEKLLGIIFDDVCVGYPAEFLGQKSKDAFHLVDALNVFLVRPRELAGVHVLELHLGLVSNQVDELTSAIHWQH